MTPRCTWTAIGWTTAEHLATCSDQACAGCKPCPKSHCELNGCATHVEQGAGIFRVDRYVMGDRDERQPA